MTHDLGQGNARILQGRTKAGVEVKVIGRVPGRAPFEVQRLAGMRLHTRTIIRDRRQAFVGSQSLRTLELDSRREVGLIIRDPKAVKQLIDTFESGLGRGGHQERSASPDPVQAPVEEPAVRPPRKRQRPSRPSRRSSSRSPIP